MSDTSTLSDIFKINYDSGSQVFAEQQNLKNYSWNKFPVSSMKPTPKGINMVVSMSGNELGSAINENESYNDPDSLNPVQPSITIRRTAWPFKLSGTSIELSETDKQAFATSIDAQQKDNLSRMFSDLNRQALGKGTGQMSLANGAGAPATALIVDNALPFRRGMKIDSYVSIGGAKEINQATITAVNYSTNTLTISPAQTWSDNSIIVKWKVQDGAPTGGKELSGAQAICDTTIYSTTFEGVPVSTNPEWQGNVISASTSPISQDLLQKALNRGRAIGGAEPNLLISNYGQPRVFLNSELQKTRYEPEDVKAGHKKLTWNTLEWQIDKDYDLNEVGMYDTKYIEKFQTKDPHLAQHDGKVLARTSGKDEVSGYYIYYGNLGTWKRNAHIRLIDLTEPVF